MDLRSHDCLKLALCLRMYCLWMQSYEVQQISLGQSCCFTCCSKNKMTVSQNSRDRHPMCPATA